MLIKHELFVMQISYKFVNINYIEIYFPFLPPFPDLIADSVWERKGILLQRKER